MSESSTEESRAARRAYVLRPDQIARRKAYVKEHPEQHAEYHRRWVEKNASSYLCVVARHRAKKRGIPFSLKVSDITVPEFCPILGLRLTLHLGQGAGGQHDSPSLDRLDNAQGYVPGNVHVISRLANSMKADATPAQLVKFAEWVLTHARLS